MNRKTRKKRKQITLGNLALFFLVLVIISAIIAYFLTRPEEQSRKSKPSTTVPAQPVTTTAKQTNNYPLSGTWVSNYDGSILDIQGTTFRMEQPSVDSHHVENGNIYIGGNIVTFIYTDSASLCKGKPGIYFFERKKGLLILKLKTDICPGRKDKFATEWDSI